MQKVKNFLQNYKESQLLANPVAFYLMLHNILHWLSLPFKVVYMLIMAMFHYTFRLPESKETHVEQIFDYQSILKRLPIWKTNIFSTYVNSVSIDHDGKQHDTDTQTAMHSLYLQMLSMTEEGKPFRDHNAEMGLVKSIHTSGHLSSGYGYTTEAEFKFNTKSTNLKTLAALNMAIDSSSNETMLDKYDQMIQSLMDNNFGLLEAALPDDEVGAALWENSKGGNKYKIKSFKANMSPRLKLSGEEALTLLATLKLNYVKNKNPDSLLEYNRLMYKMGYGALAFVPDYEASPSLDLYVSNNLNQMSLSILFKHSIGKEKAFWKAALKLHYKISGNKFAGLNNLTTLIKVSPEKKYTKALETSANLFNAIDAKANLNYMYNWTMVKSAKNTLDIN